MQQGSKQASEQSFKQSVRRQCKCKQFAGANTYNEQDCATGALCMMLENATLHSQIYLYSYDTSCVDEDDDGTMMTPVGMIMMIWYCTENTEENKSCKGCS